MQKLVEEILSFLFNISFPSCFFRIMLRVWKRLLNCILLEMRILQIIEHLYPSYHPLPLCNPSFHSLSPHSSLKHRSNTSPTYVIVTAFPFYPFPLNLSIEEGSQKIYGYPSLQS